MLVSCNLLFQSSGLKSLVTAMLAHQFAEQEFSKAQGDIHNLKISYFHLAVNPANS